MRAITPSFFRVVLAATLAAALASSAFAVESKGEANQSNDALKKSADSPKPIDFRSKVWPILKLRCLSCHGPDAQLGDLRLDSLAEIQDGGHSGSKLLGTVEDSELLRRIVSTEEGYRMPKDETPLSSDQINVIRQWIAQGANWDPPSLEERFRTWANSLYKNEHLDRLVWGHEKIGWLGYPALVLLLLVLLIERGKRAPKKVRGTASYDESQTTRLSWLNKLSQRVGYSHYLACALTFGLTAVGILHWHTYWELHELRRDTLGFSSSTSGKAKNGFEIPTPIHPMHPPRMGGEYYRGNDERSEKLFNGGFYRTATITVNLQDEQGNVLDWDSTAAPASLYVYVRIERATSATRSLFLDQAMTQTTLTRQIAAVQNHAYDDTPVRFEIEEPGESWVARYSIGDTPTASVTDPVLSGIIYVGRSASQPHYGINYQVKIREGKIGVESEIWMGAILLTGHVVQPAQNEIPISQWFGFQPIPVIDGKNSQNPSLLGLTEHQKNGPNTNNQSDDTPLPKQ